ncbi:MAG TPA: DUF1592 domain-containing protein [Opitutaceae bacterium]|nr:DUF1592 domain-containing protein [Opitutaceae bacterium]
MSRFRLPLLAALLVPVAARADDERLLKSFQDEIAPLLDQYCYDCHGFGVGKGGVTLDEFDSAEKLRDHAVWLRVLRNTRADIMPPLDEPKLPPELKARLAQWIKREAFGLDPRQPDPGHVVVRRLNRVEYRNTVRDLLGVDFDTEKEFPPDDTGHGFDNLGEVLTVSPMLLEKYLDAAQAIVAQAVPSEPWVVAERNVRGRDFTEVAPPPEPASASAAPAAAGANGPVNPPVRQGPKEAGGAMELSYYWPATIRATHRVEHAGRYVLSVDLRPIERYVDDQFDLNRCRFRFKADGEVLIDQEFVREGGRKLTFEFERQWSPGEHELVFELEPVPPAREQLRNLRIRVEGVVVRGPFTPEHRVRPARHAEFFPEPVPADPAARRAYARRILGPFATRAFRRPVDGPTLDRLADLAAAQSALPGQAFEGGVGQAMAAVLASPRFLFREEAAAVVDAGQKHPLVDEYALASRLSYFLWSTMPDAELFRLAGTGRLRAELPAQLKRMLADKRAEEFVRNFTGQWLQARDVAHVQINPVDVFLRENPMPEFEPARDTFRRLNRIPPERRTPEQKAEFDRARAIAQKVFRSPKPQLTETLRTAMRRETEMHFAHVVREDRSLVELIESDYTFLNEELANHYGVEGVSGTDMRKVQLPPGHPRGGVLTQGTVLAVTSNPTRTSPVKRGVFILENILGTPPAPPPPNIPALEDAATKEQLAKMSLRETLALHAANPLCASCHSRMDPLGLALENFNALGRWREQDQAQAIQPAGQLITGEKFTNIQGLKHILATSRRRDYFYAISEKLLTYALGRGLEHTDMDTLDHLVARLEAADGRPSALLSGIVESAPFQRRRAGDTHAAHAAQPTTPRAAPARSED